MAMGLGAFTEGLSSGIATRDKMDIARQYKEKLAQDNYTGALDIQGKRHSANTDYIANGGTQEGFDDLWGQYSKSKDPALMRFGKWLGGKMGFFNEEAGATPSMAVASPEVQQPTPQQTPIPEGSGQQPLWVPKKADGGRVAGRDITSPTSRSRNYALPEEDDSVDPRYSMDSMDIRGGYVPASERSRPKASRPIDSEPIYPRLREHQAQWSDQQDAYLEQFREGNAAQKGDAARNLVGSGVARTLQGAKDIVVDTGDFLGVDKAAQFVGGVFGFDGGGEEAVPTQAAQPQSSYPNGEYPIPDDFDPNMSLTGSDGEKKAATDATAPAPRRSDTEMADEAMSEGEKMALENLDYKTLVDKGMRPDDLPQMSTREWTDYRREQMAAMQMQGMNPSEALKVVDDMTVGVQMRGFQREATKAFQYMQTGQMQEAAMALSMAYQYFPNGAHVQFAQFDDPRSGQPVLVARAFNEETGEPTGSPQIVTAERLSVMVEQMSKPEAFRTWTKDNHELQLEIAKHKETVSHNATMEDIYGYGAETDRISANARMIDSLGGDGEGGMDYTDIDRRVKMYEEGMKRSVMYDDDIAENVGLQEDLLAIMARVGQTTGADTAQVTQLVMKAYRAGKEQGGSVEAGVKAAASLVPISEGG